MTEPPKIGLMMGIARTARFFRGDVSAAINDKIDIAPTLEGRETRAWLCDLACHRAALGVAPENDATLAHWIVEAPWAHPVWHSYSLALVHLRPMPDGRPTKFWLDGATHELWLTALDPRADRRELIATGKNCGRARLRPLNFAAQFIEIEDSLAIDRVRDAVRRICAGTLSPDTDFRRQWIALFGDNMVRK